MAIITENRQKLARSSLMGIHKPPTDDSTFLTTTKNLSARHGDYGFDAPFGLLALGLVGTIFLVAGILVIVPLSWFVLGIICLICASFLLLSTVSYLYTTRRGKFRVWAELLGRLQLHGDEQVLDMGCGRGAVLLMVAMLLPAGRATGVDLWITRDQSGNAMEVTRRNAGLEGVGERVDLYTADMRKLPFATEAFDIVVSSLAIHNIGQADGLIQAVDEAVRVLRPGGRILLADIRATRLYQARLQTLGMLEITRRSLGWRFWYGNPWGATRLISARKPA
jgi:SAM-dependent methyltransferase